MTRLQRSSSAVAAGSSRGKATAVEASLRSRLATTEIGEQLPSYRQLSSDFGVSQSVIDRAVVRLQAEGLIEARPKRGLFRSATTLPQVEIVYGGDHRGLAAGSFHSELLRVLVSEVACSGRSVRTHLSASGEGLKKMRTVARGKSQSSIITLALSDREAAEAHEMAAAGNPMVHLLPNLTAFPGCGVLPNDNEIVRLQVEHAFSRGHRSIGYLHRCGGDRYVRAWEARRVAFIEQSMQHNLRPDRDLLAFAGPEEEDVQRATRQVVQAGATAILLYEDTLIYSVYRELDALGCRPGEDIAVIGTNDRDWCDYVHPRLTSVHQDMPTLSRNVLRMLDEVERNEEPESTLAQPEMVVRASSDFECKGAVCA
jgi:LacI family transcriptional regulator